MSLTIGTCIVRATRSIKKWALLNQYYLVLGASMNSLGRQVVSGGKIRWDAGYRYSHHRYNPVGKILPNVNRYSEKKLNSYIKNKDVPKLRRSILYNCKSKRTPSVLYQSSYLKYSYFRYISEIIAREDYFQRIPRSVWSDMLIVQLEKVQHVITISIPIRVSTSNRMCVRIRLAI